MYNIILTIFSNYFRDRKSTKAIQESGEIEKEKVARMRGRPDGCEHDRRFRRKCSPQHHFASAYSGGISYSGMLFINNPICYLYTCHYKRHLEGSRFQCYYLQPAALDPSSSFTLNELLLCPFK